jgi:hypothetical protein
MMLPPERPFERRDGPIVGKSGPLASRLAQTPAVAAGSPAQWRRGNLSRIIPDMLEYMAINRV